MATNPARAVSAMAISSSLRALWISPGFLNQKGPMNVGFSPFWYTRLELFWFFWALSLESLDQLHTTGFLRFLPRSAAVAYDSITVGAQTVPIVIVCAWSTVTCTSARHNLRQRQNLAGYSCFSEPWKLMKIEGKAWDTRITRVFTLGA